MGGITMNEYDVVKLLKKYGVDYYKMSEESQEFLLYKDLTNMENILIYLVNDKKVNPRSIEKSPSIFSVSVETIKENYTFLENEDIYLSNVNNCLHILETNPNKLSETYNYILNHYGLKYLNKTTYILRIPVEKIQTVEKNFSNILSKDLILSASASKYDIYDLTKIINTCINENINIYSTIFLRDAEELKKIINVCKENEIKITGSVFHKTADDIKDIIKICKEKGVNLSNSMFSTPNDEIAKLIDICQAENLTPEGLIFRKDSANAQAIINYCKEKNIPLKKSFFRAEYTDFKDIIDFCISNNYPILEVKLRLKKI